MFVVIMTGFFIANENFLSARNIRIVMGITPEYIIVAIGIAILMISGEFDLSVGSVFALVPMTMVQLVHQGMPPWVAIALGLSIGIAVGFVNGFITLRFGIPSFIATLGMLYIARSLTTVATGGVRLIASLAHGQHHGAAAADPWRPRPGGCIPRVTFARALPAPPRKGKGRDAPLSGRVPRRMRVREPVGGPERDGLLPAPPSALTIPHATDADGMTHVRPLAAPTCADDVESGERASMFVKA